MIAVRDLRKEYEDMVAQDAAAAVPHLAALGLGTVLLGWLGAGTFRYT